MHSYKAKENTHFAYNSDLSGDVLITTNRREILVPGKDLVEFIVQFAIPKVLTTIEALLIQKAQELTEH